MRRWGVKSIVLVTVVCGAIYASRTLTRFMNYSTNEIYRSAIQLQDGIEKFILTGKLATPAPTPMKPTLDATPLTQAGGVQPKGLGWGPPSADQGPGGPAERLEQALALQQLGDAAGACDAFDALLLRTPTAPEAARAKAFREQCRRELREAADAGR